MISLKQAAAGAALVLISATASAGTSGNIGAVSEYMFRGVEQSGAPAVQGGIDWSHDSGLYLGTWASNTSFAGVTPGTTASYETDIYGGFSKDLGAVGIDVGLLYYYYRDDTALNTLEIYAGVTAGPATLKVFYTPVYFGQLDASGDDAEGTYVTLSADFGIAKGVTLTPQIGNSFGEGVQTFVVQAFSAGSAEEHYTDYSLTLSKELENGFSFSIAVIGTDNLAGDDEKLVLGLSKGFDF